MGRKWAAVAGAGTAFVVACSSDEAADVRCGAGTRLERGECVVADAGNDVATAGRGSSGGNSGKGGSSGSEGSGPDAAGSGGTAAGGSGGTAAGGAGGSGAAGRGGVGGIYIDASFGGSGGTACEPIRLQVESPKKPVDLVLAMDTSASMANENVAVQESINAFVQQISAAQVDVHVVLLAQPGVCVGAPLGSGSCPGDSKPPVFFHSPTVIVDSNNGAVRLVNAFSEYRQMLRASSLKHLFIFTDDDSTGSGAGIYADNPARFISDYSNLDPSLKDAAGNPTWRMSGMYSQTQCPNAARVGQVWKSIIDQTAGRHADLCACPAGQQATCTQAVKTFLDSVAKTIVTAANPLDCVYSLPPPPSGQTLDLNKINLELNANGVRELIPGVSSAADCHPELGGWYFDSLPQPSAVHTCPKTCDRIKATTMGSVMLAFGCATIHL